MLEGLKVLFVSALIALHLATPKHTFLGANVPKQAVKAASIHSTITTTITPEITSDTQAAIRPITVNTSVSSQKKVYGAWYWQPKLGRAQMWVGTDAQGKDVFADQLPTQTVSQQSQPSQLTTDIEKQACLEKVQAEYKAKEAGHCTTYTDQYFDVLGKCDGDFIHSFYVSLGQECGIHTRGG